MKPATYTVGPLAAASANNIALSQTPTTTLTINGALATGGVATLDTPRRVLVTTAGAESGKTLTIVGTTFGNSVVTDVLALPSTGTVASVIDFKTVTSMTISSAAAGAMTVGTNGTAGSAWFMCDAYASPNISLQVTVSGTLNYTVQQTLDDPNSPSNPVTPYLMAWKNSTDVNVVSATATMQSNYLFPPRYVRVFLNSQTNPGFATGTFVQTGGVS